MSNMTVIPPVESSAFAEAMEPLRRQIVELQTLMLHPAGELAAQAESLAVPVSEEARPPGADHLVRQLMDASLDGIALTDRGLIVTGWNAAMTRIFGIDEKAALGLNLVDLLPFLRETGDDIHLFEALQGRTTTTEARPFHSALTGRQGRFDGRYSPLRDGSGAVAGCIAILRDASERHRSEELRRAMEERYRELFETPHEIVFTSDLEGNITALNKAGERITGYS
ncbi:MAG: PAS domain S-box protein, partial [Acidobacteria bacterium]|nr:PAS domain S-box protein [Acidobacteriota bacterium]